MQHPTKQEKIEALMKANRNLDFWTACKLLGYDSKDPQLKNPNSIMDFMNGIFGGEKK